MIENLKLLKYFKVYISLFLLGLVLIDCTPRYFGFKRNITIQGCIIYTTSELLDEKNSIVSPSPPINYFFVPKKYIVGKNSNLKIANGASLYQLSVYPKELRDLFLYGNPIKCSNCQDSLKSRVTMGKFLIKKGIKVKRKSYVPQEGYFISFNENDTIDVKLCFHYRLIDVLEIED
jgi:hypothetical protein